MDEFNENEPSNGTFDHYRLCCFIQEMKTENVFAMWPYQRSAWAAGSEVGKQVSAILARHPEYFEEFRWALGGIFPAQRAVPVVQDKGITPAFALPQDKKE